MALHRYRVIQRFPWMEGGRLDATLMLCGGRAVVYEPGMTIGLEDGAVSALAHCLAATDGHGHFVLDRARAALESSAAVTMFAEWDRTDRAWLTRVMDEQLRREGRVRDLVVNMIERGEDPSTQDLAAAFAADGPRPQVLTDYAVDIQRRRRPRGPRYPRRTTWQDLAITAFYQNELARARRAHTANSRRSRAVADVAYRRTAAAFGISTRTVERVLALRRSPRRPPSM